MQISNLHVGQIVLEIKIFSKENKMVAMIKTTRFRTLFDVLNHLLEYCGAIMKILL